MKAFKPVFALVVLLSTSLLFACHDDDVKDCGVTNPAEELEWFKAKAQAAESSGDMAKYIYCLQGDYKNQRVYIWADCCPVCNSMILVYDCAGNELGRLGNGEGGIDPEAIKKQSLVWKSSTNV